MRSSRIKRPLKHGIHAGAAVLLAGSALAGQPPLPTACPAICGTAVQPFVQYGAASAAVKGTTLDVTQTTSKAVLNWANFNIANGYAVKFIQPGSTAAVLNNIWSLNPSVIAGQLSANGQVYLYNQNGIVFDKGAQVNVAGLTVSTLPFAPVANSTDPDALFENGILSGSPAGQPPAPVYVAPATGSAGSVAVDAGATLATSDGGRILLVGSSVTNRGSISTPDGQTILGGATNAVYLAASSNPSMRGLLIEVDGGGIAGTVTNDGTVTAPRGNITLAGLIVNQSGTLSATTSVNANGSIYLVAGDTSAGSDFYNANPSNPNTGPTAFGGLLPNNGGTLVLAPGSVTQVLPDSTSTATLTVPQQASFYPSEVDLAARAIALDGNASIHAPGGTVNTYAAQNPFQLVTNPKLLSVDGGSIYLDSASSIDVSGLANVPVSVTQNLIQVTLETADLQNDPLLRNGFLHGATVTVDVRDPPKLFDVTPYADNIGSNIQELLSKAGTILLDASSDVIARAGSSLNVSGGSIAYQGGYGPSTTNLLAANGSVYNISTAPSNIQYVAIANGYSYTDPTWGASTKGNGQSYYAGYLQGASAGNITVESSQVYLRGSLSGSTIDGLYQRTPATLAQGATLVVGCGGCQSQSGVANYGVQGGVTFANSLTDDVVGNVIYDGYVISATNIPAVTLLSPTQLAQSGFNTLDVYSNGTISLPHGITLGLAANGAFTAKSVEEIDIDGRIDVPGGSVTLQTPNIPNSSTEHDIDLGAGAVIDVSGTWTNDSPLVTNEPGTTPIVMNGGNVSITAAGNVTLAANSIINVSGGGWVSSSNKLSTGDAGSISLDASFNPTPGQLLYTGALSIQPGVELLGASLAAGGGGTLALQSASVTVGPAAQGTPGELQLAPSIFRQGGFKQYQVTGQDDVIIGNPDDTADVTPVTLAPLDQTLVFTLPALLQPTGRSLASFTQLTTLPLVERDPASVSFASTASLHLGSDTAGDIGDVTLERDASIVTDPGASVTLAANGYNGNVLALGSIDAPAGQILLQLLSSGSPVQAGADPGFLAAQRIELGTDAVLAAPAFDDINTLDPLGLRQGSILAGGTVSLIANKGFVQTDSGSLINVSGTAGILDLIGTQPVAPTTVAGSAGAITFDAREGIVLQGNLLASAASLNGAAVAGAQGGTLTIGLGPTYTDSGQNGTGAQNQPGIIAYPTNTRTLTMVGLAANGAPAAPPSNQLLSGTALVNERTISAGGFDNVTLTSADDIAFTGTVSLQTKASLTLDAPSFTANPGADIKLSSAYVAVGNYLNNVNYFDTGYASPNAATVLNPITGTGSLVVSAQLIDLRGISGWSGFATENFKGSGDIRLVAGENSILSPPSINVPNDSAFESAFNTTATLDLQGTQIYPTTFTTFAINDLPSAAAASTTPVPTRVTISAPPGARTPVTPLSAGGSLFINATDIDQDGVLRAPAGQIALNGANLLDAAGNVSTPGSVILASGSVTSVSAAGLIIPYGTTVNGTQWTYSPGSGITDVQTAPPAKQIALSGNEVSVNSGAKLDLSGGGDLYAYEFIAGQGGSVDVLDQASLTSSARAAGTTVYSYAIVPTLGSAFSPIDPQYAQSSTVGPNQTIYLSGVPGLAAGTYALLPAHYALLPGAYAVTLIAPNSGIAAGQAVEQPNGSYIASARLGVAGTDTLSSLTSTVLVASSATVRAESQYTDSYANEFFSAAAANSSTLTATPLLPASAGQLLLSAGATLSLNGSINFAAGSFTSGTTASGAPITQQGLGGVAAITAQNIVVVDGATSQMPGLAGSVQLDVQQLDDLDAQTLLIGAARTQTSAGERLSVGATQSVELKNTTALRAPEVIVAAQNSVTVDPGAQIVATGGNSASNQASSTLLLPGGGALLRVASGTAATLDVDPTTLPANPTGTVSIGAGANLQGAGSLLIYGTVGTTLSPAAQIGAPAISLYSSLISVGEAPAGTAGLTLTANLLGGLKSLTDLSLTSASTINFYGAVELGTPTSSTSGLASISLDAGGIGGYGTGDKILQAGTITLANSTGAAANFATAPDGSGALQFSASKAAGSGQLDLGPGSKVLSGFSGLLFHADGDIVGDGVGSLNVASASAVPLELSSVAIIGAPASEQSLTTTGAVTITRSSSVAKLTLPAVGPGAEFSVQGSSIAQNGSIDLPAGSVSLTATSGNVSLGQGSSTSTPGATQSYTVTDAVAAAGQISLIAENGSVTVDNGATIDVSGASAATALGAINGAAGSLVISAPLGTFSDAGATLKGGAASGAAQGNFSLDVGSGLGGTGFAALMTRLSSSGFTGAIDLRTHTDAAVLIDGTVKAASFELTTDHGSIEVGASGIINTSGSTLNSDAGAIMLWAGTGLTVDGGAQLLANAGSSGPVGVNGSALPGTGGDITLGTASGNIAIDGGTAAHPTTIAMQGGGDATTDGTLLLRAPRSTDDTTVQIQLQNAVGINLETRNSAVVEGVKTYAATDLGSADAGCGSGGSCDVADLNGMLYTDAATFVANSANIAGQLGLPNAEVRPGIEIDSPGDLTLDSSLTAWDLGAWHAALGAPVDVTLRAAGNIVFYASLSDGFTKNARPPSGWIFGEPGTAADSGSYLIAAGADLSSANPLSVIPQQAPATSLGAPPNSGNVILTPGTVIRTGTGNIGIAAGGDLMLGYSAGDSSGQLYQGGTLQVSEVDPLSSVIYTAGKPSVLTAAQQTLFQPPDLTGSGQKVSYPTDGGSISISVSDDIRSANSAQLVSDWLWRSGPTDGTVGPSENTTWFITFGNFEQGIGVLGGGNLSLQAGRDMVNVSAVVPTTGRLLVAEGGVPVDSDLVVTGGGNLKVQAGGNIVSGVFEDDWGNASISAGGALTSGKDSTFGQQTADYTFPGALPDPSTQIYPILVVGNGTFSVSAAAGIALAGVANSTTLPLSALNDSIVSSNDKNAAFYPYPTSGNQATLNLVSAGGDIDLARNNPTDLPIVIFSGTLFGVGYGLASDSQNYLSVYPATLSVAALTGNISLSELTLFPSATGNLTLLAAGSLNNDGQPYSIVESEANPALVPNALAPVAINTFAGLTGVPLPQQPLLQGAPTTVIVADSGDIETGSMTIPRPAYVIAGGDISDLTYAGKNYSASDATLIAAGGDIDYSTPTQAGSNSLIENPEGITLAGPGYLEVVAGGSVNLGDGNGIVTSGSLSDPRLSTAGASLIVGAGFGTESGGGLRQPAYQSFIQAYLAPTAEGAPSTYAAELISYIQQFNPGADETYAGALSAFEGLSRAQQLPLLADVLSDELSATGLAHTLSGASYDRGYTAINTLFPAKDASGDALTYDGNLDMFYSQLKTEEGGDIDLLVPGGSVVVGVTSPPTSLSLVKQYVTATNVVVPAAVDLGVLVLGEGAIQGFADQSFEVNQSRMLTLEGGNIILWASNGDIDAGRGAKSASGAPPPVIVTDSNGNLFVDPSNAVSGSGIGQLLTTPGIKPGLVNLIAPKGIVNAGDAGIRVAGNLNIAAVQVIGAANITVAGTSTGVPVSEAGAFAGALSGANSLGDASKNAVSQITQDLGAAANYEQLNQNLQPAYIVVKMFCLGVECETN